MNSVRRFLGKLFAPRSTAFLLLVPLSVMSLIYSLGDFGAPMILQIISYTLSFYTLVALCCKWNLLIRFCRDLCSRSPLLMRYVTDIRFHVTVGLALSQLVNLAYALLQLALGLRHQSLWYLSMAVYYALLFLMRFDLIFYLVRNEPGTAPRPEWRRYLFCGTVILLLSTVLVGLTTLTIHDNRFPQQNTIIEIAMAAYTFGTLGLGIYHGISYRRYSSPVIMASADVSVAAGLISLLNLTAAMLATFGSGDQMEFNRRITAGSGALIYVLILILSARMFIASHRELTRAGTHKETDHQASGPG